ncbi:hypothetical protein BAOM_2960 [Peribacillus asahii]|uniref:Uncharacterized protein n=1 Tax=Peribacillus asahii TaxID=228899 RepID=A0A3T0KT01_9BACI|nr:hypothetical protein [Peribacillus asahii]AZV43569.1 hypothetical protein BAOM_2960 [Peribacillus asahii]
MNFKLDENFVIITDPRNFTLHKLHEVNKRNGETEKDWKDIGYYWTFRGVLHRYVNEVLRDEEYTDVKQLLSKVDELHNKIEEIGEQLKVNAEQVHEYYSK